MLVMIEASVLMSVYFKEDPDFLRESLNSISSSSVAIKEIVVVKDGDISGELELCLEEFKVNYLGSVIIVGYPENRGLGHALNFGLEYCSNEIVFRFDSDDLNRNYRFECQYNILKSNPDISILGGQIEEFSNSPGDLSRIRQVPLSHADISVFLKKKNPFNHMAVAFRKSHVVECGGYVDMPGYEDYYLWFRLINSGGLCRNLDQVLVDARTGNNMLSRRRGIYLFKREMVFQWQLYREGYLSVFEFLRNAILRGCPRLLPVFVLGFIYKYFLRK